MRRFLGYLSIPVVLIGFMAGILLLTRGCLAQYDERAKIGPALAFTGSDQAVVVSMVQFDKCTSYESNGGSVHKSIHRTLSLQGNDPVTAQVRKTIEIGDFQDFKGPVQVIGAAGGRFWLFAGELQAFDPFTLERVADRARLEAANPALSGKFPEDRQYYALLPDRQALWFTAKNGIPHRLDPRTLVATPLEHEPEGRSRWDEPDFADVQRLGTIWGDRIYALLTDKERADMNGDFYNRSPSGDTALRRFYSAAYLGPTSSASYVKAGPFTPVGKSPALLQAGMLLVPATEQVMRRHDPDGFIVLHRQEIGNKGKMVVSRLDRTGQTRWSTPLAFSDLNDYLVVGDHLVLFATDNTELSSSEANILAAIDLRHGTAAIYDYFTNQMRSKVQGP